MNIIMHVTLAAASLVLGALSTYEGLFAFFIHQGLVDSDILQFEKYFKGKKLEKCDRAGKITRHTWGGPAHATQGWMGCLQVPAMHCLLFSHIRSVAGKHSPGAAALSKEPSSQQGQTHGEWVVSSWQPLKHLVARRISSGGATALGECSSLVFSCDSAIFAWWNCSSSFQKAVINCSGKVWTHLSLSVLKNDLEEEKQSKGQGVL